MIRDSKREVDSKLNSNLNKSEKKVKIFRKDKGLRKISQKIINLSIHTFIVESALFYYNCIINIVHDIFPLLITSPVHLAILFILLVR